MMIFFFRIFKNVKIIHTITLICTVHYSDQHRHLIKTYCEFILPSIFFLFISNCQNIQCKF